MKHFSFVTFILCSFLMGKAQSIQPSLINVGTVSPDAASLGKFGNIPVSYSTGIPGVTIPVFEINIGGIKLPISLDCHTSGIRVDEVSSSVGTGWALDCGGTITRNLAGRPDEAGGYLSSPDFDAVAQNPGAYMQFLYDVTTTGQADVTQDVFNYSFGGQNGKFIFNKDGSFFQIPVTNNKIQSFNGSEGMSFKITDENGLVYVFEKLETYHLNSSVTSAGTYTNVWHITKIISPNNVDEVDFTYEPACNTIAFEKSISFTYTLGSKPVCFDLPASVDELHQNYQTNSYSPVYISSITWRGGKITFQNTCDRQDRALEKRVNEIDVFANNNGTLTQVRKVKLFHSYFFNNSTGTWYQTYDDADERNYRLRLDSVGFFSTAVTDPPQMYKLTYDATPMASRETFAQDVWGFNNGQWNNGTLLAKQLVPIGVNSSNIYIPSYKYIGDANRDVDETYMKSCSLQSIQYPTGGKTVFELEPHQFSTNIPAVITETTSCAAYGGVQQTSSTSFLYSASEQNPIYNISLSKYNYSGVTGRPMATLTDQTSGQVVLSVTNMTPDQDYSLTLVPIALVDGHTYVMNVNIYTTTVAQMHGSFDITWNHVTNNIETRKGGGLRVKTIANYNNSESLVNKELYTYGNGEDGIGTLLTPYNYFSQTSKSIVYRMGCAQGNNDVALHTNCVYYAGYTTMQYNSGSMNPLTQFSGSPILYETVTKYQLDANGVKANGKSVYNYSVFVDDQAISAPDVYNQGFLLQPNSWRNGRLLMESIYKSNASGGFDIRHQKVYNYLEDRTASTKGLQIIPIYLHDPETCYLFDPNAASLDYHVELYSINTGVYLLQSVADIAFDDNGSQITMTDSYSYNDPTHLFPTSKQSVNSKKVVLAENLKYPNDFASAGNVYASMVNRNIIAPVVQSQKLNNGTQTFLTKANYFDWLGNANLVEPKTIDQQIRNSAIESRVQFNQYDVYGNILEQQKVKDIKEVYFWGYNRQYLVAKIIGSDYNTAKQFIDQDILDNPSSDQQLRDELNKLRVNLPQAQVITYTYLPLVGMSSMTDIRGNSTYYEYDAFSRLSVIRDKDMNILKKICYNYAGQPEDCYVGAYCSSFNCSGPDKKCITGTCQTGVRVNTSSTLMDTGLYACVYHYEFPDGSWSVSYTDFSSSPCPIHIIITN